LLLVAKQENGSEYTWWIGDDPTPRKGKETLVTFGRDYGEIPITLAVKKEVDTSCFPQDDGIDTVRKVIDLITYYELDTWGMYRGYNEDQPGHFFDIEVRLDTIYNGGPQEKPHMYNLPEGCPKMQLLTMGANGFRFPSDGGASSDCLYARGKAQLLSLDSISITFHVTERNREANNNLLSRTFIGTRQ
jgi:hypothetical protein